MVKKRIRLIVLLTAAAVGLVVVPASAQELLGGNSESPALPAIDHAIKSNLTKNLDPNHLDLDRITREHWSKTNKDAARPMSLSKVGAATGGENLQNLLPNKSVPSTPSLSNVEDIPATSNQRLPDPSAGSPLLDKGLGSRDIGSKLLTPKSAVDQSLNDATQLPSADSTTPKSASNTSVQPQQWSGGGAIIKIMGEVFFTMGDTDYTASATVLQSASNAKNRKDIVVTAAHNIEDSQGNRATNWMIAPGYHNGNEPFGEWTARELQVAPGWTRNHNEDSDVGFAVMNPRNSKHIADAVGGARIGFNTSKDVSVSAFGYPGYKGESLKVCSNKATRPNRNRQAAARAIDCNMAEGSSGGAWCWKDKNHSGDCTIVSVNAYSYNNEMSVMHGPVLGDEAKRTYEKAQRA